MVRIALLALALLACKAKDKAPAGPIKPPMIVASGGKVMPEGYTTTVKDRGGASLELGFTQMTSLVFEGHPAVQLIAEDGRMPAKTLTINFDVAKLKPRRADDLAGVNLYPVPGTSAVLSLRAGDPDSTFHSRRAWITITNVSADAIEGTLNAEFSPDWKFFGMKFRALLSPGMAEDALSATTGAARTTPAAAP